MAKQKKAKKTVKKKVETPVTTEPDQDPNPGQATNQDPGDLPRPVALSGIQLEIVDEAKKIATGEVTGCYKLTTLAKELMAFERQFPAAYSQS